MAKLRILRKSRTNGNLPHVKEGALLRDARLALGYTQQYIMAQLTGDPDAPAGHYQNWERGANRPKIEQFAPLSSILKIDVRSIYAPVESPSVPKFLRAAVISVTDIESHITVLKREVRFLEGLVAEHRQRQGHEQPERSEQPPRMRIQPRLQQPQPQPGPPRSIKQQHSDR